MNTNGCDRSVYIGEIQIDTNSVEINWIDGAIIKAWKNDIKSYKIFYIYNDVY